MKIEILGIPFEVIAPTYTNGKGTTSTRSIHAQTAQVWRSFENGLTRTEISAQLNMSPSTVTTHIGKCIRKVTPFIKKEDILEGLARHKVQLTQQDKNLYAVYKKLLEKGIKT